MLARAQGHNFKSQGNRRLKIEEGSEPVVACGSELGTHFYAVRQFAVWHN